MLFQGTIVNAAAVVAGSLLGMRLGKKVSRPMQELLLTALGLSALLIGAQLALRTEHLTLVIASLILGGLLGRLLRLEHRLEAFGEWLREVTARLPGLRGLEAKAPAVDGEAPPLSTSQAPAGPPGGAESQQQRSGVGRAFVTASLIFCIGPLTIMGSIKDGARGEPDLLYTKSALDGTCSVALTAGMGPGVIFAAVSIVVVQGTLTLAGYFGQTFITDTVLTEVLAAGGLLTVAIGFELLGIKRLPVAEFLPALLLAGVGAWLLG